MFYMRVLDNEICSNYKTAVYKIKSNLKQNSTKKDYSHMIRTCNQDVSVRTSKYYFPYGDISIDFNILMIALFTL